MLVILNIAHPHWKSLSNSHAMLPRDSAGASVGRLGLCFGWHSEALKSAAGWVASERFRGSSGSWWFMVPRGFGSWKGPKADDRGPKSWLKLGSKWPRDVLTSDLQWLTGKETRTLWTVRAMVSSKCALYPSSQTWICGLDPSKEYCMFPWTLKLSDIPVNKRAKKRLYAGLGTRKQKNGA